MTLSPDDILGVAINRVVCTEPPAQYYSGYANFALDLTEEGWLGIGSGTIRYGELPNGVKLYPAVAWQHSKLLTAEELHDILAGAHIKRLIRTRASGYDQSMLALSNDIVIGNCDQGGQRLLFVRSKFDKKREPDTQYWDYFSNQPVDHLGNDVEGEPRDPFRVSWV